VDVKRFVVVVIRRPGYVHSEAFREVAEAVFFGLKSAGADVIWSETAFVTDRIPIIFGANLAVRPTEIPSNAIIYNLEQADNSSTWLVEPYLTILQTHQVWDYSIRNVERLQLQGITDIRCVPIGYVRELERITEAPKDIDVLFYGSMCPRRQWVIEQLRESGVAVVTTFGTYGADRDALIARSRIVLNVHFYESKIFEIVRVSYLLANGVCVLSEDGHDPMEEEFRDAVAFASYEDLVTRCLELLADDTLRQGYGNRGRELMRKRPQDEYLLAVIQDITTMTPYPPSHPTVLNVGSGKDWKAEYLNIDISDEWAPDIIFDLNEELPASGAVFSTERFGEVKFIDEVFDLIICNDVLEHLAQLATAMTTCLRILKPGGVFSISVPYDLSWGAWQDPTHVRAFNERSWLYYTDWSWYMGWDTWKFDLKSLTYMLSPIGQQMVALGAAQDVVVRTPRAVDSMSVELVKRALNDAERQEYVLRHARGA
jgi:SAM-dependent methyltransferase